MKTKRPYTESFLKGLESLTGISYGKLESYSRDNSLLNVLEHPKCLDVDDKQLKKIGLLNEIIVSYNLLKNYEREDKIQFKSPHQVANYFVPLLSGVKDKERFMVAFLDAKNSIIETQIMSEGTVSQAAVYPREILKKALDCSCSSMVIAHNHPGGGEPSKADIEVTQRLIDIFTPLDIAILDHIIVAGIDYTSLREDGLMPQNSKNRANYEPIRLGENTFKENIENDDVYEEFVKKEGWGLEM